MKPNRRSPPKQVRWMTATIAAALPLLGLGLAAPASATAFRTEGESGRFFPCGDDGMAVKNLADASGGRVLFFGSSGCRATYTAGSIAGQHVGIVTVVQFTTTGNFGDPVCGFWEIVDGGLVVGRTVPTCGENLELRVAPVVPPAVVAGSFAVVWRTALGTPVFANGLLDYLDVV